MIRYRYAALNPVTGVVQGHLVGGAGQSCEGRAHEGVGLGQGVLDGGERGVLVDDHPTGRYPHVVKVDLTLGEGALAQLVEWPTPRDAFQVEGHDADAPLGEPAVAVDRAEKGGHVGDGPV